MLNSLHLNKKGFTLIELIVVLAIAGIVITAVGSFLISNMKTFNVGDDQIECQHQAQLVADKIVEAAMESKGISMVKNSSGLSIGSSYSPPADPEYIGEIDFTYDNKPDVKFGFSKTSGKVSYNGNAIAGYITQLIVEPMPSGQSYTDCSGIRITVVSTKNQSHIQVNNEVYFRNK